MSGDRRFLQKIYSCHGPVAKPTLGGNELRLILFILVWSAKMNRKLILKSHRFVSFWCQFTCPDSRLSSSTSGRGQTRPWCRGQTRPWCRRCGGGGTWLGLWLGRLVLRGKCKTIQSNAICYQTLVILGLIMLTFFCTESWFCMSSKVLAKESCRYNAQLWASNQLLRRNNITANQKHLEQIFLICPS